LNHTHTGYYVRTEKQRNNMNPVTFGGGGADLYKWKGKF
jgi:hypothetical protein